MADVAARLLVFMVAVNIFSGVEPPNSVVRNSSNAFGSQEWNTQS